MDDYLEQRLQDIRSSGLYRSLRHVESPQGPRLLVDGRSLLNFSSNDYLGLANDPLLKKAAQQALEKYGVGAGASRLISGSLQPHHELETALAEFKGTEAALCFASGYATALGTITALLSRQDIIIIDKKVHACIVDAARQCGAKLRVYAHNDLDQLESILQWASEKVSASHQTASDQVPSRILVVTESVFSMDGNLASLKEIVQLKNQYGAWLMLDEAHATGLFGDHGRGLAEAFDVGADIDIQMGTLGKALGVMGGYICGSKRLIDFLINQARSFIFSTAPSPVLSAAAREAIRFVLSPEGVVRRQTLWILVDRIKQGLIESGWVLPAVQSPIIPIMAGDEAKAVALSDQLREMGLFIPAIRYPTVARGEARLRLTVTAAHEVAHVETLQAAFKDLASS